VIKQLILVLDRGGATWHPPYFILNIFVIIFLMSKPKKEIATSSYETTIDEFYYYLSGLSKPDLERFVADVLTDSEVRMMHRRWHIAILLSAGLEYRAVASIANVSTGTVMSVKKLMLSDKESVSKAIKHFKDIKKDEVLADNRTIA